MSDGLSQQASQPPLAGGGGGDTTPTASWAEDVQADDALVVRPIVSDDVEVADAFAAALVANPEVATVDDALSVPLLSSAYAEDVQANDLTKVQILEIDVARTGTPDTDMIWDLWLEQAAPTTNHGNESLQVRGSTAGTNAKQGYLGFDMTALTGFTGVGLLTGGSALRLTFQASNSNAAIAATLTCIFYTNASRPKTESTSTWNSAGSTGTSQGSTTVSIAPGGGFASYTISLTPAVVTAACGNWLLFEFLGSSGAAPDTITIKSRDDATASNRPKISLAVQRGS